MGLPIQPRQFFVQLLKLLFKIKIFDSALGYANIATRVEAPALRSNFVESCNFTEARNIRVDPIGKVLGHEGSAVVIGLDWFATVEARNIGQEFDLFRRKLAVCAIDLPVNMAGIDEQHF